MNRASVKLKALPFAQIIHRMGQAGFEQQKCEAHEMIQGAPVEFIDGSG